MSRWCLLNKEWIGSNFKPKEKVCPYGCNACGLKDYIPPKPWDGLGGYFDKYKNNATKDDELP